MKIKLKKPAVIRGGVWSAGAEVEVNEETGRLLIKLGQAEEIIAHEAGGNLAEGFVPEKDEDEAEIDPPAG